MASQSDWIRRTIMDSGLTIGAGSVQAVAQLLPRHLTENQLLDPQSVVMATENVLKAVIDHFHSELDCLTPQSIEAVAKAGSVSNMLESSEDNVYIECISAKDVPRFSFNPSTGHFVE
jgi:hypothetical protein